MSEKIINIQDTFLNYIRKNKVPVTVFLLNGVKLNGIVSCFDQHSIVVRREGYTQLVYKHAISTFSPHGVISIFNWNGSQSNAPRQTTEEMEEDYDKEDFEDNYDDDE